MPDVVEQGYVEANSAGTLLAQATAAATATLPNGSQEGVLVVLSQGPLRLKGATAAADLAMTQGSTGPRPVFLLLDSFGNIVDPTGLIVVFSMRVAASGVEAATGSSMGSNPKIVIQPHISVPDTSVLGNVRTYLNCPQLHFAAADVANAGTFNAKLLYVDANGDTCSGQFTVQIILDKS